MGAVVAAGLGAAVGGAAVGTGVGAGAQAARITTTSKIALIHNVRLVLRNIVFFSFFFATVRNLSSLIPSNVERTRAANPVVSRSSPLYRQLSKHGRDE